MITITKARYAKGKVVASSPSDGSGWKTKEHRLCERIGGRWVHRDGGYQMSLAQAKRLQKVAPRMPEHFEVSDQTNGLLV